MHLKNLALSWKEKGLIEKALKIYKNKNKVGASVEDVILESLQTYIELYQKRFGEEDELSKKAVYGVQHKREPVTDLDEVARILVNHRECARCGECCKRTIGVKLSSEEVEEIEALGYSRKDFLDEDGYIKRVVGGCYFLRRAGAEKYRCEIYPVRPEICTNYFCKKSK